MNRLFSILKAKWIEYILELSILFLGVYGAFSLDRWNEERLRDREFNVLLEQYYNAIYIDLQSYRNGLYMVNEHLYLANALSNSKERSWL